MPEYLHPGVYVEEVPGGNRPVEGIPTSIIAIVGLHDHTGNLQIVLSKNYFPPAKSRN